VFVLNYIKRLVRPKQKSLLVLLYHKVVNDVVPDGLTVNPEIYLEHLRFYKATFPVFSSIDEWREGNSSGVMITFDDGYVNNLNIVAPMHESLEIPFTIFMTTHWLEGRFFWWDIITQNKDWLASSNKMGTDEVLNSLMNLPHIEQKEKRVDELIFKYQLKNELNKDLRCMNIAELSALSNSKWVNIGSHTISHPRLALLSNENQEVELINSKIELEKITGKQIDCLSYPHGGKQAFNQESKMLASKIGYKYAFAAYSGKVSNAFDPYEIPRIHIGNYDVNELKQKLAKFL
jgi:peptidoglycan/xylan/chitin deacetylase (PgdA/CDA1 family)